MLWGARLSAFLLFRIIKTGKDDRFDDKRDKFFSFLGFWIFQMIWVWTVSLPVTILNSPNVTRFPQPDFGTGRDIAGVIFFGVGFILESVSDIQKYIFRSNPENKGKVCDVGFFTWSRHPNYFGEIIIQFGMLLFCLGLLSVVLISIRYFHDCGITCCIWLRKWWSIQRTLCVYTRSFLSDTPTYVCFRLDTSRETGRKEEI